MKEKPIVPKIREKRLELLLLILSIVQGLAFTKLIEVTIEVLKTTANPIESAVITIHSIFCFLIILRLFETILLGFLDYDEAVASFKEVIMIFIVGSLEYWLIDSLSEFSPAKFYLRVVVLASFSLIGYIATTIKISSKKHMRILFDDFSSYRREIKLQVVNICVPVTIITFAILIMNGVLSSGVTLILVALILSALVLINIVVSWVMTVTGPEVIIPWDYKPGTEPLEIKLKRDPITVDSTLKQALATDSLIIAELYLRLFPYVFRDVFETSDKFLAKILAKIVSFNGGKSYFGYKNIILAKEYGDNEIATGFITMEGSKAAKIIDNIRLGLYTIFYVLYFTGLWGVYRVIKNTLKNRKASHKIREEELYISYIGVLPEYRRRGIAGKLIQHAELVARSSGKEILGLDVRKDNAQAINLFLSYGFKEIYRVEDGAFGKPARIYMSKALP